MTGNFLGFLVIYISLRNENLTKSINSECSLTELYGGTENLIIILIVAISIALGSIYLLDKEFRKNKQEI